MFRAVVDYFRRLLNFAWPQALRKREWFSNSVQDDPLQPKTVDTSVPPSSPGISMAWYGKKNALQNLQTTETLIGFFVPETSQDAAQERKPPSEQSLGSQIDANFAVPLPEASSFIMTKDSFAQFILTKAKEVKPETVLVYDSTDFSIRSQTSDQQVMYLHNAYLEYNRCKTEERPYVLKKWLRHLLFLKQIPEEFEDVEPDLMPALRTKGYFELIQLKFRSQNRDMPAFPYQDVGEHFGLTVAYDMNDSIIMISQKHLDSWNLTFYEAMEIAMRNLHEKGCVITSLTLEDKFKVYIPSVGDSFDATRLLLVDHIRDLEVHGDTIAMIVSPDAMMITGSEDRLGMTFLLSQAMESRDKPHAIPPILLKLVGDEWKTWLPPESSEFYFPFKQFQVMLFGSDYSEQQNLLKNIYKVEGRDISVANFFVAQREATRQLFTYTVWANGNQDLLLPKAEYIAFMEDEKATPIVIPWDIVEETVGYLMSPRSLYPTRVHVGVYPTQREIEEMQRLSNHVNPFE